MLKALVLLALIYLFVRMFLNYKPSLFTTKTWKQNNHSFISDNNDLFTPNESSFGFHQGYQETEINPATGLPMMGCVDVCGNPYGFDLHHCGRSHGIRTCGGFSHDD
jgi:hypothetical protein